MQKLRTSKNKIKTFKYIYWFIKERLDYDESYLFIQAK